MPPKRYNSRLTHEDIIWLFDTGRYHVCLESGTVSRTSFGKPRKDGTRKEFLCPIFTYAGGKHYLNKADHDHYRFVRLYCSPKFIVIPVAHVVWIYGTRSAIPPKYEIHHYDLNPANNAFENLYCMHPDDHRKLHRRLSEELKDVPF